MLFTVGNSVLLLLEMTSPFFGWWHSFSLCASLFFTGSSSAMLQYYSKRMAENIYLLESGKMIEIEFFNAFLENKKALFHINELGYL